VAILDTGIAWDRNSLRRRIHLNPGELPVPQHDRATPASDAPSVPPCASFGDSYDANGDGAFNVLDYVCDSRVGVAAGANGDPQRLDAEDLIATFSDSTDADSNGYVDDIAGWDFFDDDNDPYDASSYSSANFHGSGRASDAAEEGNDGEGSIGVCPRCQIMPLRVWDSFVVDTNNYGEAVGYAADNGAEIVEGAAEILLVGQDRDRVGAARRVRPGERQRIEGGGQHAARRRRLLHLGDEPDAAGRGAQRGLEVARRSLARAVTLERGARRRGLAAGHLRALVADDVVEDTQRPQKSFRSPARRSVSSGTRVS
jgi:hypothetical protein